MRVQKSYSPYTIFYGPCLSCSANLLHIYRHLSSPNPDCLPALSLTRFNPDGDRLSITRHNTQLWSCLPHRCIRENTRISFIDHIHSLRAQALPSGTVSYKQKSLIVPPVLALSLSLSLLCPLAAMS